MKAPVAFAVMLLVAMGLGACQALPAPSPTPVPTIAATDGVYIPNLENGETVWKNAQCAACHGPTALGGIGRQLAATKLPHSRFVQVVRTAAPPMPAYDEAMLSDQNAYDIYAWVRTQLPPLQSVTPPISTPAGSMPDMEEMMSMTIWTCRKCSTCHGVFAQGSATAPALAGVSASEEKELAQMRSTAGTIPEHDAENMPDEIFGRVYDWLKMGCLTNECSQ